MDQILVPVAKMVSSHNGTCSHDLSQGLVPSSVPTLKLGLSSLHPIPPTLSVQISKV